MDTTLLNQAFEIPGVIQFYNGSGNLPFVAVTNQFCKAAISLYGAQVMSYVPTGQADVLWVSSRSMFEEGKAIRSGIPVCFPWFGPHPADKTKPQHGFARTSTWVVKSVDELKDGSTKLQLGLQQSAETLELWPHNFEAIIGFTFGTSLQIDFTVTNTGNELFQYSDALHTYFNISDIAAISLSGFDKAVFYEAFGTELFEQETAALYPGKENNRRYVDHTAEAIISDPGFNRKIKASKTGSKVTVVWNPGPETTLKMPDIDPQGYKTFICIEPANAYPGIDMISLEPGGKFTLSAHIEIA